MVTRFLVVRGEGRKALTQTHVDRPTDGFHWYYWRIEQEGVSPAYPGNLKVAEGHLAWVEPASGLGCAVTDALSKTIDHRDRLTLLLDG